MALINFSKSLIDAYPTVEGFTDEGTGIKIYHSSTLRLVSLPLILRLNPLTGLLMEGVIART